MEDNLQKRLFDFIVRVIKFLKTLPNTQENYILSNQLIKSATSTGANYEESQAASSEEIVNDKKELRLLNEESRELKLILGSIVSKTKNN
jgi:hypothetical protein